MGKVNIRKWVPDQNLLSTFVTLYSHVGLEVSHEVNQS